jgi:hypothetical protein
MKIKFSVIVVVLSLIVQLSSTAQTLIGGKIGLINSNLGFKYKPNSLGALLTFENKLGIGASFFVQKYHSKKISLDFNAQYGNFGAKLTDDFKFNVHYFSVPVMVAYDIFQSDKVAFNVHSGFTPSFFVGGNRMTGDVKEKIESGMDIFGLDFFWEIGAGIVFYQTEKIAVRADVNLVRGLLNVRGDNDTDDVVSMKNKATTIMIGVARKI